MIIDLTDEELDFLLRLCTRAKKFNNMGIEPPGMQFPIAFRKDMVKLDSLLGKLRSEGRGASDS